MRVPVETYKVIFSGNTLNGYSPDEVSKNMANAFKLDAEEALERLFSSKVITLKRGLNYDAATHYCSIMNKIGADCCIEYEANILSAGIEPDNDYKRKRQRIVAHFEQHNLEKVGLMPK